MDEQSQSNTQTFTLTDNSNGRHFELPVIEGTVGPKVIDVRRLYLETGCFTYDPGYTSTGSCESRITYIDGENGMELWCNTNLYSNMDPYGYKLGAQY